MIILKPEDKPEVEAAEKWLLDRGDDGCFIKASGITANVDIIAEICVLWCKHKDAKKGV